MPVSEHLFLLETQLICQIRTEPEGIFLFFGLCQMDHVGRSLFKDSDHFTAVINFSTHDLLNGRTAGGAVLAQSVMETGKNQQMTEIFHQYPQGTGTPAHIGFSSEKCNGTTQLFNDVGTDKGGVAPFFDCGAETFPATAVEIQIVTERLFTVDTEDMVAVVGSLFRLHGRNADQQRPGEPPFTHVAVEEIAAQSGLIVAQSLTEQKESVCNSFGICFRHGVCNCRFDSCSDVNGSPGLFLKSRFDDLRTDAAFLHLQFRSLKVDDHIVKTVSFGDLFKNGDGIFKTNRLILTTADGVDGAAG